MTAAHVSEACRLYILVVLVVSGVGKARTISSFAEAVERLVELPARWSRYAAIAVVALEILVALVLAPGGRVVPYGVGIALAMFVVFTVVLLGALVRRQTVSCNCFGADDHPISGFDIARNGMLIAACTIQLVLGPPAVAIAVGAWPLLLGAAVIAFLISTNLRRIATLLGLMRNAEPAELPPGLPMGQIVPAFEGRTAGRRFISEELAGQPAVLLFMSSGCPKCRGKVPELLRLLPAIRDAGIRLWIVPADSKHDISLLLGGSALLEHVLTLEPSGRELLNPRRATPLYIFIDHQMIALASGQIGDENWHSFVEQMNEDGGVQNS